MSARYRFVLIEDPEVRLPVRYRRAPRTPPIWVRQVDPLEVLLEAFWRLNRRGVGEQAWAPALAEDPLTFLLDAIGDAVVLRSQEGRLMYANPAAQALSPPETRRVESELERVDLGECRYERRCMRFQLGAQNLVLEVMRRLER